MVIFSQWTCLNIFIYCCTFYKVHFFPKVRAMRVTVTRKDVKFIPDSSRVVTRYFMNGDERTRKMVSQLMALDEKQASLSLEHTLREFAGRHRNISRVFFKHCANIQGISEGMEINYAELSDARKMLIGSYCTMEYSIESAAFFNPEIVEDIDQLYLEKGGERSNYFFSRHGRRSYIVHCFQKGNY